MTGSWRQFFLAVFLIAFFPVLSPAEEPSKEIDPSLVIEQFDVFGDGDFLLVPVNVFGKTRQFVVDTGASITVYDQRLRPNLGKPTRTAPITTVHEKKTIQCFNAASARLGGLNLQTEAPVASVDLAHMREVTGHEIEGVIGMAFLHQFIVHIDFNAGRLSFLNRVPEHAGERMHLFYVKGSRPLVLAQIQGAEMEFFSIDTGLRGVACLRSNLFDRLAKEGQVATTSAIFVSDASGGRTVHGGFLKGLSLSNLEFHGVPVSAISDHQANLLGSGILCRFTITFDFPNKAVYLSPNRSFHRPFVGNIGCIDFIRKDGNTVVRSLHSSGPASQAGIRAGDRLLEIDGHHAAAVRLFTLDRIFGTPGTTVHLKLERGNEVIEVDVKLPEKETQGAEEATEPAAVRTANASEGSQQ